MLLVNGKLARDNYRVSEEESSEFRTAILSLPWLKGATLNEGSRTILIIAMGEEQFKLVLWSGESLDLDEIEKLLARQGVKVKRSEELTEAGRGSLSCTVREDEIVTLAMKAARALGIPIKAKISKETHLRMNIRTSG
jgi:hypothetical protein